MSIKLKDMLFEMSNNEVYDIFENAKERSIEDNIQTLSKATLEMVSKAIAAKINSEIPSIENISEDVLSKPLGIITFQMLKKLGMVSIKGLKLDPAQVKGEQKQGLSPIDFSKYEKQQIIPLFLTNKEMENLGGSKGDDEFAAIFYIPAIYAPILSDNLTLHKSLFGIQDPPKGKAAMHVSVNKLHYEMINPDEMELVQKSFMTGNSTPIQRIEKMQAKRRPTGSNEPVGGRDNQQDIEDEQQDIEGEENEETDLDQQKLAASYNRLDLNRLHENSLSSLLFEKKIDEAETRWYHKFFGGKEPDVEKGSDTSYTFVDVDDLDKELDVDEKPKEGKKSKIAQELIKLNVVPEDDVTGVGLTFKNSGRADIGSDAVTSFKFKDPFKGSAQSVGAANYLPTIDRSNFDAIVNAICKNDGSIDARKLNKAMPKTIASLSDLDAIDENDDPTTYTNPGVNPLILINPAGESGPGAITYKLEGTSFELKNLSVKDNFDILSKNIYEKDHSSGSGDDFQVAFKIFIKKDADEGIQNLCGQKYLEKIARLAQSFNEKTVDDELLVRRFKAANYYIAILRNFNDKFLSNDVDAAYKVLCTTGLDADLTDSDVYFSKNVQGKVVEDDEDANKVKDAIEYLKQRNTANRSVWQGFKHNDKDDTESDNSLDAVIANIVDDNADKLLNKAANEISDFIKDVERIVKDVKFDFESAKGSVEKGKEVFEYYGAGAELLKKIYQIVTSAIKGDADHVPMSGDQAERVGEKEKKGDFLKEFDKVFQDEFKRVNPILNKEYNLKSKDFIGNEYVIEIAKSIKEGKNIKVDLDELVERQMEMDNIESFINANAVLRKLKEDKADLTTQLEKLDEASFEEDLKKVMTKKIINSIQGILGSNSSLLDHKNYSNNLMLEINDKLALGVGAATLIAGVISNFFIPGGSLWLSIPSLVVAGGLTARSIYKGTITWDEHTKQLAGRGKYESMDMYADAIIEASKDIVLRSCSAVVGNMYAAGLIGIEDKLKESGVTLTYTSESLEKLSLDTKSSQEKANKKENLNETGKKIYSEIINAAYEFKNNSPIGKYINESSVENMLIKSMFDGEIRNKFSSLMDLLQKEDKKEKENMGDGLVYKLGLRFLMNEAEGEKGKETKERIEIDRLRVQLATIITKEFGTASFKNDLNQAFTREFKKYEKELPGMFNFGSKGRRKKIANVLYKVMNKVLGMSKKDVKAFFEDNINLLESLNFDDIDLILENQDLTMLLEAAKFDAFQKLYHTKGGNYFIEFISNHSKHPAANGPYVIQIEPSQINAAGNITAKTALSSNLLSGSQAKAAIAGSTDVTAQMSTDPVLHNIVASAGKNTTSGVSGLSFDPNKLPPKTPPGPPRTGGEGGAMSGLELASWLTSLLMLANLSLMVANWIRPVLHKNIKKGAELQKVLANCEWNSLPGAAFAEIICQILLANKAALAEEGILITGKLSKPTSPSEASSLGSSTLVNKVRQSSKFNKNVKSEDISDEDIMNVIEKDLSRICLGIVRKYDKQKYKDAMQTADSDTYKSEVTGWKGFIRSKNPVDVNARIKEETIVSNRDKALKAATAGDVKALSQAIVSLIKDKKDLVPESLLLNKLVLENDFYLEALSSLIFEEVSTPDNVNISGASKTNITAKELQETLSSTGVLVYGSDLDPDSAEFRKAENYLLGTIANFIKVNFGVEVSGVDQFKQLNMVEEAVEATVNRAAPAGQAASKEVDNMAKGAGVPQDSNSKVNIDQLMNLLNKCGGDSMSSILMLLIENPGLLSQLLNLQKKGGSFGDAAKIISAESEELSDLDRQINVAIKQERVDFPKMSKTTVKKLFKVLNKKPFEKITNVNSIKAGINIKDSQTFIAHLKEYFNITDKDIDYDVKGEQALFNFITVRAYNDLNKISFDDDNSFINVYVVFYGIATFVARFLEQPNEFSKNLMAHQKEGFINAGTKTVDPFFDLENKNVDDKIEILKTKYGITCAKVTTPDPRDLLLKLTDDDFPKFVKLVEDSYATVLKDMKSISLEESRFRRARVLKSKRQSSSIMSEAKFLEQEFRRLWNLK